MLLPLFVLKKIHICIVKITKIKRIFLKEISFIFFINNSEEITFLRNDTITAIISMIKIAKQYLKTTPTENQNEFYKIYSTALRNKCSKMRKGCGEISTSNHYHLGKIYSSYITCREMEISMHQPTFDKIS